MDEIEEKPKKKVKQLSVHIVSATPENTLVEFTYGGIFQRATIPTQEIHDEKAAEDTLLAGIPYGIPWEFVELSASSILLANSLRANGIWTYEDAMRSPKLIVSALQAAYGVDLAALLQYARENK